MGKKLTTKAFVIKAVKQHENAYDYSKVVYVSARNKVTIICEQHGEFKQMPGDHLRGRGCKLCSHAKKKGYNPDRKKHPKQHTTQSFISLAKKKHNSFYTYEKVIYKNDRLKVRVTCPIHGVFEQSPNSHLRGSGCKQCRGEKLSKKFNQGKGAFLRKAEKSHGNKYNYEKVIYKNALSKIKIICPTHGTFEQTPACHYWEEQGCPICSNRHPKAENDLANFIQSCVEGLEIVRDSKLINPLELDIAIPSLKVAFEFNGLYWHNTKFKNKNYHKLKTDLCAKKGYRLIHIWEDDWHHKPEVLKSFIQSLLGVRGQIVYGRHTKLKVIDSTTADAFLSANHIQGSCRKTKATGLYKDGALLSVCCFIKRQKGYELNRHACLLGTQVLGALGKHTSWARKNLNGQLVSFCDLSMYTGGSYEKAGFITESLLSPDYKYVVKGKRVHKFNFRRKALPKFLADKFIPALSEVQNMEQNGYYRIFDCGKTKYNLLKENKGEA